jgi:hypothetical protein
MILSLPNTRKKKVKKKANGVYGAGKRSCGQTKLWTDEAVKRRSCGKTKLWKDEAVKRRSCGQTKLWKDEAVERRSCGKTKLKKKLWNENSAKGGQKGCDRGYCVTSHCSLVEIGMHAPATHGVEPAFL